MEQEAYQEHANEDECNGADQVQKKAEVINDAENGVDLVGETSPEKDCAADDCVGADKYIEIWKKGLLCDVFFEVGDQKRRFCAHRLILAFFSTVFHTWFFGNEHPTDESTKEKPTLVPDVNADAFELMLRFMYSGENIDSIQITDQVVVHLLHAAEKYHIPRLKHACTQMLETISPTSAPRILQQALLCNYQDLAERCCDIICKDGDSFLASEGFLECDFRALKMIVERDKFYIESEMVLLERLRKRAPVKCNEIQVEETMPEKPADFESLLHLVRFPLMTIEELEEVARLNILTEKEIGQLFKSKSAESTTCDGFISQERVRPDLHEDCHLVRSPECEDGTGDSNGKQQFVLRRFSKFEDPQQAKYRFMCFSVDRKINITGLGVTDVAGDTAEIGTYDFYVYVDPDCDASKIWRWTQFRPQSVERRGRVVHIMSDQFPPPIPHKRYWLLIYFKDCGSKTYNCGPESARAGKKTVPVRSRDVNKDETVTFTYSSADVEKSPPPTDKMDNRFLAEIYFTL